MPLAEAVTAYVDEILRHRRDEATVIDAPLTEAITLPVRISSGPEDWRANV